VPAPVAEAAVIRRGEENDDSLMVGIEKDHSFTARINQGEIAT